LFSKLQSVGSFFLSIAHRHFEISQKSLNFLKQTHLAIGVPSDLGNIIRPVFQSEKSNVMQWTSKNSKDSFPPKQPTNLVLHDKEQEETA
jgi:hypothetical protein